MVYSVICLRSLASGKITTGNGVGSGSVLVPLSLAKTPYFAVRIYNTENKRVAAGSSNAVVMHCD